MKYRKLQADELQELESEFVRFLAANSITAEEWEKLKKDSPEKVGSLIEQFSDIVFEKILEGVKMLERRQKEEIQIFRFFEEQAEMVGLRVKGQTQLDFREKDSPQEMMEKLNHSGAQLQLMHAEKKYRKQREMEIFELMQAGCLILKDDSLYQTLKDLIEGQKQNKSQ